MAVYEPGIVVIANETDKGQDIYHVDHWWCVGPRIAVSAFMDRIKKQQHERQWP